MPSLEESRRQVRESLDKQAAHKPDHDDILASLQDEIDKHNAVKDDLRRTMRRDKRHREAGDETERTPEPSMKFRFKAGTSEPRKRKHRSRREGDREERKHRKRDSPAPPEDETTHPVPREPVADLNQPLPADSFQDSLFDALAHDEGAHYWQDVYSQPIHVYTRPTVRTPKGELEEMNDEQYAAHVKMRMWERKHPEIVLERERSERRKKEEEEEKTKRREEFLRRKEQSAWERAERRGARRHGSGSDSEERYQPHVRHEWDESSETAEHKTRQREYTAVWSRYLAAWDSLKHDLLSERTAPDEPSVPPSKLIPWPVLETKPVIKTNIEAFMRHSPATEDRTRLQLLKAERVRWHPDKIQQRFGGKVDEGTMKLVTGVFQVVDSLFEEERKRVG
ncbi:hypothetical protein LTR08_005149 [Meristemomyces frigidus]|nr:hypothetical protein LTR08_005149 [Meristemomyces frigidus]